MMRREYFKNINTWDLFSGLILLCLSVLQITRWPATPQFLDIYYHLQVAWGFIQAGGYSSWDFWEYAPFGRPHIYPPLFHLLLALLMKLGVSLIFLAKFFELVTPVIFLFVMWNFIRKNYGQQLGFFVTVALGSSFAFFVSLANHTPSVFALILGILSFGEFYKNRLLRAGILLTLCFYTHFSVSWFFALSYIFYAVMDRNSRINSLRIVFYSLLVALPILISAFLKLHAIHLVGDNPPEGAYLQIKIFNYILASFGLFLAAKMSTRYKLFISLFLASFIFLSYPYRFLSAEGHLPVILLSALTMQFIWQKLKEKLSRLKEIAIGALIVFCLLISPALLLEKSAVSNKASYKVDWVDAAFSGLLLAKGGSLWYPWMYFPTIDIIKANSNSTDIVYTSINFAGIILSSLSQRATANALLPETVPFTKLDPFPVSNIIVLAKDSGEEFINGISNKYNLIKIQENKYFSVFRNPAPTYRLKIINAVLGFPAIISISFLLVGLFWGKELMGIFRNNLKKCSPRTKV